MTDFHSLQSRALHAPLDPKTQTRQILYEAIGNPLVQATRYKMDFSEAGSEEVKKKSKAIRRRVKRFKTRTEDVLQQLRENGHLKQKRLKKQIYANSDRDRIVLEKRRNEKENGIPLSIKERKLAKKMKKEFDKNEKLLKDLRDRMFLLAGGKKKMSVSRKNLSKLSRSVSRASSRRSSQGKKPSGVPPRAVCESPTRNKGGGIASTQLSTGDENEEDDDGMFRFDGGDEGVAPPEETEEQGTGSRKEHDGKPFELGANVQVFCPVGRSMGRAKRNFVNRGTVVFFDEASENQLRDSIDFEITKKALAHVPRGYKRRFDNTYVVRYEDNEIEDGVVFSRITTHVSRSMQVFQEDMAKKKQEEEKIIANIGKTVTKPNNAPKRTNLFAKLKAEREAKQFKSKELQAKMEKQRKKFQKQKKFEEKCREKIYRLEHKKAMDHRKQMIELQKRKSLESVADEKAVERAREHLLTREEKEIILRERSHERKLQADSVKKRLNDKLKAIEDKEMAKINAETIEHQNKIKEKLSLPEEKTTYAEMQAEETKRRAKDDLVRKKIAQKKKERQETERAQAILVEQDRCRHNLTNIMDKIMHWPVDNHQVNTSLEEKGNDDEDDGTKRDAKKPKKSRSSKSLDPGVHSNAKHILILLEDLKHDISHTGDRKKIVRLKKKLENLQNDGARAAIKLRTALKQCKEKKMAIDEDSFPGLGEAREVLKHPDFSSSRKAAQTAQTKQAVPVRRKDAALRRIFDAIDIDASGKVTLREMKDILVKHVDKNPEIYDAINNVASLRPFLYYEAKDLDEDFRNVDADGDSKLDFDEFSNFVKGVLASRSQLLLDQLFEEFDADKNGTVSLQEVKRGLKNNKFIRNLLQYTPLQSLLLPESMKAAIETMDSNGDGTISRDELSSFLDVANTRSDHEFLVTYKGKTVVCGNRAEKDRLMHLEKTAQEENEKKANADKNIAVFQKGNRYVVPKSSREKDIKKASKAKRLKAKQKEKEVQQMIKNGIEKKLAQRVPLLADQKPTSKQDMRNDVRKAVMIQAMKQI